MAAAVTSNRVIPEKIPHCRKTRGPDQGSIAPAAHAHHNRDFWRKTGMDTQGITSAFGLNRRRMLAGFALLAGTPLLSQTASAQDASDASNKELDSGSAYITTKDGLRIYYKDWGLRDAQPIVFHHGWPLSSDDWDNQLMFLRRE
jgi:hypothetical protein